MKHVGRCSGRRLSLMCIMTPLMVLASAACRDTPRNPSPRESVAERRANRDTNDVPHEHDTIDAPRGVWSTRSVIGALVSNGLGPVKFDGVVHQPFIGPGGSRLRIPGAEIQVYVYADALARARDTDLIDSVKVAPRRLHVAWRLPASIIPVNNAALIVLTADSSLRRRIHAAVRLHE